MMFSKSAAFAGFLDSMYASSPVFAKPSALIRMNVNNATNAKNMIVGTMKTPVVSVTTISIYTKRILWNN